MNLGWPYRRCILCGRELSAAVPFSRAHLVPESIGGFAWAWTKCKGCNEQAGSSIEAAVIRDDSIICAVGILRAELPELAAKFDERTRWVAQSEHGRIEARLYDGAFQLLTTKDDDGARRQSTADARGGLETRLRREGHGDEEVAAALSLFDQVEKGTPFEIAGETFIHGDTRSDFGLPFDGEPVLDVFPSLIAFHFLAFALGERIYDARLDELRAAICAGEAHSAWHIAESRITRQYEAMHLVGLAQCQPHVVVRVQLFGWSVWRVHFPRLVIGGDPLGLHFDLKANTIALAKPRLSRPLTVPEPE